MKYTFIYMDYWTSGSHQQSIPRMKRITLNEGETLKEIMQTDPDLDSTVMIFEGHPKLEGEV